MFHQISYTHHPKLACALQAAQRVRVRRARASLSTRGLGASISLIELEAPLSAPATNACYIPIESVAPPSTEWVCLQMRYAPRARRRNGSNDKRPSQLWKSLATPKRLDCSYSAGTTLLSAPLLFPATEKSLLSHKPPKMTYREPSQRTMRPGQKIGYLLARQSYQLKMCGDS